MTYPGKYGLIGTLSLFFLVGITTTAPAADDALAWPALTAQSRPWVWWWWHGSAVDQTNIAHELQRFHDAGLGGVQITSIYGVRGAETRDIPYLTPAWLAMMGYTVDEAQRLGMGVDMTLGSGWCFGGPTVSDQDANASVGVKTFDVAAGEKLNAKFNRASTQALVAFSPDGKSVELTDKISADGEVNWTAPAGSWTVYAISQKPSGQKVKRAAPGGEGWMLNPAYPQAVRDWLPWFDAAFANYTGSKPQAVFQDSYEYRTDWAPDFFAQFEKLRGYKLQTELPALLAAPERSEGGFAADSLITNHASLDLDHIARVKYDYRRTISDIMAEQSEPAWIDWAHKNGFSTIYQAHGTPGNWLDLYGDADIPETEMFHNDRSVLISKFASSAAHTQGRALTGAETGTWLKEHFTETLADLKYLADDMFLAGINHIYYHGACYSPDDAPWPGWLFYASTEMNPRNSIWRDVPALNEYVARCQSILQSGKPDNDVLLYWPVADFWSDPAGRVQPMSVSRTEWFEDQPIGKTAHELWNKGYTFDYVSDRQLLAAKVVDGKIQMPGGDYKVIVVPECKFMPLETFKQLLALAGNGATIYFETLKQSDVCGWGNLQGRREEYLKLYNSLFPHGIDISDSNYPIYASRGKGLVAFNHIETVLDKATVAREPMVDLELSFVRRSFGGGWNYFIANRGTNAFDDVILLGRDAKSAVILDPMTGVSGLAAIQITNVNGSFLASHSNYLAFCHEVVNRWNNLKLVHLQLPPGGSLILRAFADKRVEGPAWTYWQTNGQPAEITGEWKVKFVAGGQVLPADFQTTRLASWTTFPDTNTQAFAGTAKYEITFDAPKLEFNLQVAPNTLKRELQHYYLDLGDVRQSARVKLNGKDYGTLITPPFRVVVDNLKPTGNRLELEVTSVSANRIRDLDRRGVQWKIFKDINIVNVNYHPFDASNWPLTNCGLLGPVTLTAVTTETK
jgi:hypothetical protein